MFLSGKDLFMYRFNKVKEFMMKLAMVAVALSYLTIVAVMFG